MSLSNAPHAPMPGNRSLTNAPEAGSGRNRVLEDLYQKHWKNLCAWIRRRFGDGPPEPEDLAQSAFERFATLDDFDLIRDKRAFLYTVAARSAVDALRSREVMRRYIDDALAEHGRAVGEITPEHVYWAREEVRALSEDLAALSDKHRETVIRSRFLGQSYEQIAADTGWSTSAISRYLRTAMATLTRNAQARRAAAMSPEASEIAGDRHS